MGAIFNISSNLPFLETLAKGIVERFGDRLDKTTIYLPTRRASRPLSEAFYKIAGKALLLPKIQTIGDVDEEELYLRYFPNFEKVEPAIGSTRRLYEIARLINEKEKLKGMVPDFAQSIALAKSLISLIDELHNKGLELSSLNNVVPADFSEHWQITLDFLKIISEDWHGFLLKHKLTEPIKHRNILIEKLAGFYNDKPSNDPVIIAGTTGSIPSTVKLIQAVLGNQNGYLVIDGLDRYYGDNDFKILEETHPQYNLGQLLNKLNVAPSAVGEWQNTELTERQKLISTALFPTERTPEWKNFKCKPHDIHLIEAGNAEEEAMAIAVALRETLETSDKTAMLVTSNRALAERVAAKMRIWDVEINDSAGENMARLPASTFLLELVEMVRSHQAPVEVLSFFKHPFIPVELKTKIREIEAEFLRGPRISGFNIAEHGIEIEGLKQMEQLFKQNYCNLLELFDLHIKIAESIAGRNKLWGREGLEVYEFLNEYRESIDPKHNIDPMIYPEVLAQFLATKTYRPPYGTHPRLNIFEPPEARMQPAHIVIIAGMNEGSFPQLPSQDSFMNQQIRRQIGLDLLSRKIGQAAHDFELLAQADKLILTRSKKEGGSPTVKSRFLQRLEAICEVKAGEKYCEWARGLYEPTVAVKPAPRPEPRPPAEARPTELSATRVGRLRRDPYVIYAEKILRLKKLDEIDEEVTANKFGDFIHNSLEKFAKDYGDGSLERLIKHGEDEFKKYANKPAMRTFWWPKFLKIAEWFVENERKVRSNGQQLYFEERGEIKYGKMTFTAKADRVEVDGGVKIIDYKTGAPPSFNFVEAGLDPQLAIEAIIFSDRYAKPATEIEYWYLVGKDDNRVEIKAPKREKVQAIIDLARKGLAQVAEEFLKESTPFLARPWSTYALKYNEYEHLERIKEWDE